MNFTRWVWLGVLLVGILTSQARSDTYPRRPVKLIVSFAAGGVGDVLGRLLAQALQEKLAQSVVVENRPGGDGTIGMREAIRATPDGYTLLVGGLGGQIIPQLMRDDFPFDVRKDLVKIAISGIYPNVLVVNNDLPVNSVKELIAYLKARPGQLNFGSSGRASSDRLAAELFMMETGTRMLNVPYKGGGIALNDLIAGVTQVMFPQLPAVIGSALAGQVKPIAVTTSNRLSQLPHVPTLTETELPGFNVGGWNALYGPRGLPNDVRDTLSKAIVTAVKEPELAARLKTLGVEPIGIGSDEATTFFNAEFVRWKEVIDAAGLKLEK
jgi:tripartite-type tricarboxylate transporter receptor subunit TctC